jgi:Carboxypeptidase regulatory-like domain
MISAGRRFLVIVLFVLSAIATASAQQRGTISGRVVDPSDLALPGVTVTITNQSTGFERTVVTAENGAYLVSNLDPGTKGARV